MKKYIALILALIFLSAGAAFAAPEKIEYKWRVTFPSPRLMVINNETACFVAADDTIYALSLTDGKKLWSTPVARWEKKTGDFSYKQFIGAGIKKLFYEDGSVFAATEKGLFILDADTGVIKRWIPALSWAYDKGIIYSRESGRMIVRNASTGKRLCEEWMGSDNYTFIPAFGKLYVYNYSQGYFEVHDGKTLERIKEVPLEETITITPPAPPAPPSPNEISPPPPPGDTTASPPPYRRIIPGDNLIYVIIPGVTAAFDPVTLKKIWHVETGLVEKAWLVKSLLYLLEEKKVTCLDAVSGKIIRSRNFNSKFLSGFVAGDRFFVVDDARVVYIFDKSGISSIAIDDNDNDIKSLDADDSRLLLCTGDKFMLYDIASKKLIRETEADQNTYTEAIAGENKLFIEEGTELCMLGSGVTAPRVFLGATTINIQSHEDGSLVRSVNPRITIEGGNIEKIKFSAYPLVKLNYDKKTKRPDYKNSEYKTTPFKTWENKCYLDGMERSKKVVLPLEECGIYKIVAEANGKTSTAYLQITRLSLMLKTEPGRLYLQVEDSKTHQIIDDAAVKIWNSEYLENGNHKKTLIYEGKPGFIKYNLTKESWLDISVEKGDDSSSWSGHVSSSYFYSRRKFYYYADRPLYRPGQKVHFRGIVRDEEPDGYVNPGKIPVEMVIWGPERTIIAMKKIFTDEFGAFSDEIILDNDASLGNYHISFCAIFSPDSEKELFTVSEYRKPEFKVELKPVKDSYIMGDKAEFILRASTYFGVPVPSANVKYSVFNRMSPYYPEFYSNIPDKYIRESYNCDYGEIITDSKGEARISIDTQKTEQNYILVVNATITDLSRREVTAGASCPVTRGDFFIHVIPDKMLYKKGETVRLKIKANGFSLKPVTTDVKVTISEEDMKNCEIISTIFREGTASTDSQGNGEFTFTAERTGFLKAAIQAVDARGNTIEDYCHFWVFQKGSSLTTQHDDFELLSDKESYKPGDVAHLVIRTPAKEGLLTASIEGNKIYKIFHLPIDNYNASLDLPILSEYGPNVFLSASIVSNENLFERTMEIKVSPSDKFINLELIPNKEKYSPGEEANYKIRTTDHLGKPVPAEVSLGLVDEAIYALMPDTDPDIKDFFYGERVNMVDTLPIPPPMPACAKAPPQEKDIGPIRKKFEDTAYWNAAVITGKDGTAEVSFPLPDNLTTWRATGKAINMDTLVGQAQKDCLVDKKLALRLETPRFLLQDDELEISAVIHNNTGKDEVVSVSFQAEGVSLLDTPDKKTPVPSGGMGRVEWKIGVNSLPPGGKAALTAFAKASDTSDAVRLELPVFPHGQKKTELFSGIENKSFEQAFDVPENIIPNSSMLRVSVAPSVAGGMFDGLEYLATYPYGCTEQVMSSFLPDVVLYNALKEFGIENKELEKKLPDMLKKGLDKLYLNQHEDGGWGWWKNDTSRPYMTAYVIYGLSIANKSGYDIDNWRLEIGTKRLEEFLTEVIPLKTKAYILNVLSGIKKPDVSKFDEVLSENIRKSKELKDVEAAIAAQSDAKKQELLQKKIQIENTILDNDSLALLAEAYYNAGEKEKAKSVLDMLESTGGTYWASRKGCYDWSGSTTETTAHALRAYLKIDPENPVIIKAVTWLAGKKKGLSWDSTKDTAAVIIAMTDYLKKARELNPDYRLNVYLNGKLLQKLEFKAADGMKPGIVLNSKDLLPGKNRLRFEKEGQGKIYYSIDMTDYLKVPEIKAESCGISVDREYLSQKEGSTDWIEVNAEDIKTGNINETNEAPPRQQKPEDIKIKIKLDDGKLVIDSPRYIQQMNPDLLKKILTEQWEKLSKPLMTGERLKVRLRITADADYEYVSLEDPLPSGFEVEADKDEGIFTRKENHDRKVVFFLSNLPKGTSEISYIIRPETPGVFHAMPAQIELMYVPEIYGNSDEAKIIVFPIKEEQSPK
ncbi:MAG: MG2 domain-containing protein [Chloroflexi bacterium]|nr:MG2 domain-containing protein [Chloroflexota bacterium]